VETPKVARAGPISIEERRKYRADLVAWGSDAKWGRPEESVACAVWELLRDKLPFGIEDLLPRTRSKIPSSTEDYLVAKQSLIVALDCAVSAVCAGKKGRGAMLTFNRLFDALAKRWSISYRQARHAAVSYDMDPARLPAIYHELRHVVRVDTLYALVALPWDRRKDGAENPLYSVWVSKKGRSYRRWVRLRHGSADLQAFDRAVNADRQYRRAIRRRLLLAENWTPRKRRQRQDVCAEQPYNVVNLGRNSRRTLRHLEAAQVRFNIDVFRKDYEKAEQVHNRTPAQDAFVEGYRSIYLDTEGLSGTRHIRSRFFRAVNRRYNAVNFWPENVPKRHRAAWFGVETLVVTAPPQAVGEDKPYLFVDRDISSSQTQILAAFLGLDDLEALARNTDPKFKVYLARRLWALHEERGGNLLADGYEKDGETLIEFAKTTWMRYLYGSPFDVIAKDLAEEPEKYGRGWKTTRGLDAKAVHTKREGGPSLSGGQEAKIRAQTFFNSLPTWRLPLQTYLDACRSLSTTEGGVAFHDPWDGEEIRWNPAQRAQSWIELDNHIAVRPWGVLLSVQKFERLTGESVRDAEGKLLRVKKFEARPAGTVDESKLRRMVAPCLIHTLDAAYSSMVIEKLAAAGVSDFVAIHDGWWVPDSFLSTHEHEDFREICDGEEELTTAIERAGEPWLTSLGGVYRSLDGYLGTHPIYGPFVKDIQARWQARKAWGEPPRFTAG